MGDCAYFLLLCIFLFLLVAVITRLMLQLLMYADFLNFCVAEAQLRLSRDVDLKCRCNGPFSIIMPWMIGLIFQILCIFVFACYCNCLLAGDMSHFLHLFAA